MIKASLKVVSNPSEKALWYVIKISMTGKLKTPHSSYLAVPQIRYSVLSLTTSAEAILSSTERFVSVFCGLAISKCETALCHLYSALNLVFC